MTLFTYSFCFVLHSNYTMCKSDPLLRCNQQNTPLTTEACSCVILQVVYYFAKYKLRRVTKLQHIRYTSIEHVVWYFQEFYLANRKVTTYIPL